MVKQGNEWKLQEAAAHFADVLRLARSQGPQRIIEEGERAVVVLPAEEYDRLAGQRAGNRQSLVETLAEARLHELDMSLPIEYGKDVEL